MRADTDEPVMVILGYRHPDINGPMPATICDWPHQRRVKYQHITDDQLRLMEGETARLWHAAFAEDGTGGRWWLKEPL